MSNAFEIAKEAYGIYNVDLEDVLGKLSSTPISIHCWQGDDVIGFEQGAGALGSGLAVTGNYPGRARNIEELRQDLEKAISLIPGNHRLNLHAIYGDFDGQSVDRNEIEPKHFQSWFEWCKNNQMGMDFNPSCFSHSKASDGLTLSHPDEGIRKFWIEHCQKSRLVSEAAGKYLGDASIMNIWVPDGMKDTAVSKKIFRDHLEESLDEVLSQSLPKEYHIDAVESKLFGIGSESFVVGSHEFYLGYAIKKQIALCLDAGHFHPTEGIADKISSVMRYVPEMLLHVSRGIRWDSDHVVIYDDATRSICEELVRSDALDKTHIGLDFFDASINRITAWVTGVRATQKCLLSALLEPKELLAKYELEGNYSARLALLEELKALPMGLVWNEFCSRNNVPTGLNWMTDVDAYENSVLSKRG